MVILDHIYICASGKTRSKLPATVFDESISETRNITLLAHGQAVSFLDFIIDFLHFGLGVADLGELVRGWGDADRLSGGEKAKL